MPAARKAKPPTRAELARELLEIERDNAATFTRIDAIKAELKLFAGRDGKFRETFAGLGHVSVSPAKPEEKYGTAPGLVITAWDALTDRRRETLLADGIVANFDLIKGAYHGRCDVKLFAPPQGAAS